jgi:hypothetical protein
MQRLTSTKLFSRSCLLPPRQLLCLPQGDMSSPCPVKKPPSNHSCRTIRSYVFLQGLFGEVGRAVTMCPSAYLANLANPTVTARRDLRLAIRLSRLGSTHCLTHLRHQSELWPSCGIKVVICYTTCWRSEEISIFKPAAAPAISFEYLCGDC